MSYVLGLADCTADRAGRVGGKARGLQTLIEQDLAVPPGFAVTTDAYRDYVASAGIAERITDLLEEAGTPEADAVVSRKIEELFDLADLAAELAAEIDDAYGELGRGPVAIRSSAIAEDTADASFAGQQDTYLWIEGTDAVVRHVRRCWASLFTPRAIAYRARMGVAPEDVLMCVVVQRMVPAAAAGVMMTLEPVTGDRAQIYVEAAHGLGEGVVRGNVETDRFWVDKDDLSVRREEIGEQAEAYLFDQDAGEVRITPLDPQHGARRSLSADTVRTVAELGRRIEAHHGRPMDVEWAVTEDDEVFLVQARPETVWSNRKPLPPPGAGHDVLHAQSRDASWWTTTNAGEAIPGVPTPLCWLIWGGGAEAALRRSFRQLGVLSAAEAQRPDTEEDRLLSIFHGRPAFQIDLLHAWGERIPGTSGNAVAEQICGFTPPGFASHAELRYYPIALVGAVKAIVTAPRVARRSRLEGQRFWRESTARLPLLDESAAADLLGVAADRFVESAVRQCYVVFGAAQPAYDIMCRLATWTGADAPSLMSGLGNHEEARVVHDMWDCSRDLLDPAEFLVRHGFHGPNEGETASVSWREDPAPALRLIDRYRAAPDDASPRTADEQRARRRGELERELLGRLSVPRRLVARLALAFAARGLPLRGAAKVALIQSNDVARGAARRLGTLLVGRGALDEVDDVFFLTLEELRGALPADARERVAERRGHRAAYQQVDVPTVWQGNPEAGVAEIDTSSNSITGIAASPGIVEAIARVVHDPADARIETGEILVARDTDQGWASLMFLSGGLVADIGGVMSHTAVVARELGIPCVVNTRVGTRRLQSGDRIRLDGARGTVEILDPAEADQANSNQETAWT